VSNRRPRLAALSLALALAGCGRGVARPTVETPTVERAAPDPCLIAPPTATRADTVTVAADGESKPELVLQPRARSGLLMSALVFETLVRVTCSGQVEPGLAERWQSQNDGRDWTFTLRAGAAFTDGSPVTAEDVVASWRERRSVSGRADPRAAVVDGVAIVGARQLTVRLRTAYGEVPRILADPVFAVHRRSAGVLVGSSAHVAPTGGDSLTAAGGDRFTVMTPRTSGSAAVIRLYNNTSGDARDLLDRGVDLLLTEDRRTVEYAASRNDYDVRSLPSDRAFMLVLTTAESGLNADDADPRWTPLRMSLERDILRRGNPATPEGWWASPTALSNCSIPLSPTTPRWTRSASRRLVYAERDRAAGEVARRLVALATDARGTSEPSVALRELSPELAAAGTQAVVATGLSDAELARSLMQGADFAYLVAWQRRPLDPCAAWAAVTVDAPWIRPALAARVADTGPSLIVGRRAPSVVLDWSNTFRLLPPP
jgi:hypothetical protein